MYPLSAICGRPIQSATPLFALIESRCSEMTGEMSSILISTVSQSSLYLVKPRNRALTFRNKVGRIIFPIRVAFCLTVLLNSVFLLAFLTGTSCYLPATSEKVPAKVSQNENSVLQHGLFELTVEHKNSYRNKFFDVSLVAHFLSPAGSKRTIKGFYYGWDCWKLRFRPDEVGAWKYVFEMTGDRNFLDKGEGNFECKSGKEEGRVLRHPDNPYRWIFANGKPYFPIGLQDCVGNKGYDLKDMFVDGDTGRSNPTKVTAAEYLAIYGQGGLNLLRFSQKNCSFSLYDDLDHYRVEESISTDKLLSMARMNGFRIMFGFFGYHGTSDNRNTLAGILQRILDGSPGPREEALNDPENVEILSKEKRFVDYCISRWGVYVDIWELLNERKASDEWTTMMADYVRSVDPDCKPISTSWAKPHLVSIDINAPHWYESENELQSDLRVVEQATKWKQAGKPVIVGEHGNMGMNWDPLSAQRMRVRGWTALFQEITLVFWNTSWSKAGMHEGKPQPGKAANIFLGPEERGYIRSLQDFSFRLDADVRMVPVKVSSPEVVRAYGLKSKSVAAVYMHHFENHAEAVHNLRMTPDLPNSPESKTGFLGEWIDPSTGKPLQRLNIPASQHELEVPPFVVDIALLITINHNE